MKKLMKPIHYTYENRQAIRRGDKTMTRRLFHSLKGFGEITEFGPSDTPGYDWHFRNKRMLWNDISTERLLECVRYQVGGVLYMHEPIEFVKFRRIAGGDGAYIKYLDNGEGDYRIIPERVKLPSLGPWKGRTIPPEWSKPPYHKVLTVGCEQLQSISEEDCIREGVGSGFQMNGGWPDYQHIENGVCTLTQDTAVMSFATLWDSIHKLKHPWAANDWVIVYGYEEVMV